MKAPRPRRAGVSRPAFSIVEVMIAVAGGLVLTITAWFVLTSSTRVMTRGQTKLVDTTQAELVFRWLEGDLHSLVAPPTVADKPPRIVLQRHSGDEGVATVEWRLVSTADGRGSKVERRVVLGGAGGPQASVFCLEALAGATLAPVNVPGHPGLTVKITMRTVTDPVPATFAETFFYRNQVVETGWNPIPPL